MGKPMGWICQNTQITEGTKFELDKGHLTHTLRFGATHVIVTDEWIAENMGQFIDLSALIQQVEQDIVFTSMGVK